MGRDNVVNNANGQDSVKLSMIEPMVVTQARVVSGEAER